MHRRCVNIAAMDTSIPLSQIQASCQLVFASRQRVAQLVPPEMRTATELPGFLAKLADERREKARLLLEQANALTVASESFLTKQSPEGDDVV